MRRLNGRCISSTLSLLVAVSTLLCAKSFSQVSTRDQNLQIKFDILRILKLSQLSELTSMLGPGIEHETLPDIHVPQIQIVFVTYEWGYLGYSLVEKTKVGILGVRYTFKSLAASPEQALAMTNLSIFGKAAPHKTNNMWVWNSVQVEGHAYTAELSADLTSLGVYAGTVPIPLD